MIIESIKKLLSVSLRTGIGQFCPISLQRTGREEVLIKTGKKYILPDKLMMLWIRENYG